MPEPRRSHGIRWASDHALLVTLAERAGATTREKVLSAVASLRGAAIPGRLDIRAGYTSVLVTVDPLASAPEEVEAAVRAAIDATDPVRPAAPRTVEIPVCYEPPHAIDLEDIARWRGLAPGEVVRIHASADYVVCFLGFSPGFPYLDGLPEALHMPRLAAPRRRVPEGSVAIAGPQAGIYPRATPGGWRILGRTPVRLFRAELDSPALLAPGDRIRFVPVDGRAFLDLVQER